MDIDKVELNKIQIDKFGKKSGILLLNKPPGITSHDLVDQVRKELNMKRVGHAGALDPFASGLMIILVGKATNLSNKFLNKDKEYVFEVLLGITTDTLDPEGKVVDVKEVKDIDKPKLEKILKTFQKSYKQTVPIYSSIKVNGCRLRELARASKQIKIDKSFVTFVFDPDNSFYKRRLKNKLKSAFEHTVELPTREVDIKSLKLFGLKTIAATHLSMKDPLIRDNLSFKLAKVSAFVSKGTYIRQLAFDIGKKLNIPAMLYSLTRTGIGDFASYDAIDHNSVRFSIS